tara:strand:- start:753 stop:2870 length:2118 start_codon:yes stop_codon:yes gene_type:complete
MKLSNNQTQKLSIIIILIWPYIYLFPLTFGLIVMGNDFDLIYFSYKRYIAEMLSEGILPLWSPVEGSGSSLVYNPFAQYFYIPGWINYLIHYITKNLTLHTYLLYTIFGISIFSLGIFHWLKSLKVDHLIAFLSALIIACSLKLTELLRFPNAIHAAAWMPWILYGINLMYIGDTKKSFLLIFISNFFILTAGYPYFIVYSLFLFIPYIITIPFIFEDKKDYKKLYFYFLNFFPFAFSYLIALPWLLKVKYFLKNLVDRTENNWEFATQHTFYLKDTIGSWIFPPASSTEGWYYNGIIISLIIFFGLFFLFFEKKKIDIVDKKFLIYSLIFFIFITYFSWGKNSLLFEWSWNNIPLIGSLRTWPRINIIIIPFIILLFAISLKYFIKYVNELSKEKIKKILYPLLGIFFILLLLQFIFLFLEYQNDEYWNFWQKKRFDAAINSLPFIFSNILKLYDGPIYLIFNIISLSLLIFYVLNKNFLKFKKRFLYFSILSLVSLELFSISNLQWSLEAWKTNLYKSVNPLEQLQKAFESKRIIDTVKGNEYFRDNRRFNINYPDNYGFNPHAKNYTKYFKRYEGEKNIDITDDQINIVKYFFGASDESRKIFFTQKLHKNNISLFVNDSINYEKKSNFINKILIKKYNGNNLDLEISTDNDGWLNFIDNWDPDWIATVNSKKVEIFKSLGSYKSIKVKKGFSKVKFQYKPW